MSNKMWNCWSFRHLPNWLIRSGALRCMCYELTSLTSHNLSQMSKLLYPQLSEGSHQSVYFLFDCTKLNTYSWDRLRTTTFCFATNVHVIRTTAFLLTFAMLNELIKLLQSASQLYRYATDVVEKVAVCKGSNKYAFVVHIAVLIAQSSTFCLRYT